MDLSLWLLHAHSQCMRGYPGRGRNAACLLHDSFHLFSIDIQLYTIYNRYLCKVCGKNETCMSIMLIICLYISFHSIFIFKLSGIFTIHIHLYLSISLYLSLGLLATSALQFKWNCVDLIYGVFSTISNICVKEIAIYILLKGEGMREKERGIKRGKIKCW